jgi:hypothetical protein
MAAFDAVAGLGAPSIIVVRNRVPDGAIGAAATAVSRSTCPGVGCPGHPDRDRRVGLSL